jgi:hypothetical protein
MSKRFGVAVLGVLAALVSVSTSNEARALGGVTGELVGGGTVTGDISLEAGETDTIGVNLVQGATMDLKFSATFASSVECVDATGAAVTIAWAGTTAQTATGVPVGSTGRHQFRIRSTGGQGVYSLTVTPRWTTKIALTGAMGTPVTVAMPTGASLKGKITATTFTPTIDAVESPDGSQLLAAALTGKNGAVKLPPVFARAPGLHRVAVGGGEAGGTFSALMKMKAPKVKPVKLDVRNGLTPISFANDGVGTLLVAKCGACHAWSNSATSFKPFAKSSLSRVISGQMPQGGPKMPAAEVSLIRSWIETGMNQ